MSIKKGSLFFGLVSNIMAGDLEIFGSGQHSEHHCVHRWRSVEGFVHRWRSVEGRQGVMNLCPSLLMNQLVQVVRNNGWELETTKKPS